MKLAIALNKLKNLKSKVTRTETYIEACVVQYEDEPSEYNYEEEVQNRTLLENEIMQLKTRIQLTNASTPVNFGGTNMSLAAAILLNARLRTDLAYWNKMLAHSTETATLYRERTKDHVKKVYAPGFDKNQIRKTIDSLEFQKEQLESLIAAANLQTDLFGSVPAQAQTEEAKSE